MRTDDLCNRNLMSNFSQKRPLFLPPFLTPFLTPIFTPLFRPPKPPIYRPPLPPLPEVTPSAGGSNIYFLPPGCQKKCFWGYFGGGLWVKLCPQRSMSPGPLFELKFRVFRGYPPFFGFWGFRTHFRGGRGGCPG
jgi:hypothetical protein